MEWLMLWLLVGITLSASAAAECVCCAGCAGYSLDFVITGPDPCVLSCVGSPPFSGDVTVAGAGTMGTPSSNIWSKTYNESINPVIIYGDEACTIPLGEFPAYMVLNVFCNDEPNEDGKRYGLILFLHTVTDYYLADLQADSADWFTLEEAAMGILVSTPCGDYTVFLEPTP